MEILHKNPNCSTPNRTKAFEMSFYGSKTDIIHCVRFSNTNTAGIKIYAANSEGFEMDKQKILLDPYSFMEFECVLHGAGAVGENESWCKLCDLHLPGNPFTYWKTKELLI